jgi:WD40 repeat protein
LKSLRQKMSGLELYEGFTPNRELRHASLDNFRLTNSLPEIKITPERVYALKFHPTEDKPLIFAGDKVGNVGIFDASQTGAEANAENDDPEPSITAYNIHSKSITSLVIPADGNSLYTSSYDSSIRRLDLQKGVAVEVYAPESLNMDVPISAISIPPTEPNLVFFSTLDGSLGRHDMRTAKDTEVWQLSDKKIGGFSLHPLYPYLAATASLDRTLKIWDLRKVSGKGESRVPHLIAEHESRLSVSHAAFSAAGHVATSSYDDTIKIHSFTDAGSWKAGHDVDSQAMSPTASIRHNNQTGRWVTILKPQWQERPADGIQKFVIGNMNRFVDVYTSDGEQLAQLGGDGISAVPAVTQFHPTQDWVAGGTASGKLCLWM